MAPQKIPSLGVAVGGGGSGYRPLKLHDLPARMRQRMLMRLLALQAPDGFCIRRAAIGVSENGNSNRENMRI